MSTEAQTNGAILKAHAHTPDNVVYRTFVAETVVLNLNTGKYHTVNPTGGRMLEVLDKVHSIEQAATVLAQDYGRPLAEIQEDLCEFCSALEQRGLIVLSNEPNG